MDVKKLEELALKLNLTMSEKEYDTLKGEFDIMLKQMDYIGTIEGIENVEPMSFPFPVTYTLRSDEEIDNLKKEDVLINSENHDSDFVIVPKVVGEE